MKRILLAAAGGFAAISLLLAMAQPALAGNRFIVVDGNNDTARLSENETHDGSLYLVGATVEVNGTVDGDVYCAAQKLVVNGTVKGDLICAAQQVEIKGTVEQDVRLAGQLVDVTGQIGRNVSVLGQEFKLHDSAQIAGSLNGAVQMAIISGQVARDVALGLDNFQLAGKIGGNADLAATSIEMRENARIEGDLSYTSETNQSVNENAVAGNVSFSQTESESDAEKGLAVVAGLLSAVLTAIVTTLALVALAPRYFEKSYKLIRRRFGMSVLIGAAVLFAPPLLLLIVAISGIGLMLAIIGFTAWLLVLLLSYVFAGYYLGRLAFDKVVNNSLLVAFGGAALLAILSAIPILNLLVIPAALVIGSGGLVMTVASGYKKPTYSLRDKS